MIGLLRIRNLAVIEQLELELGPGLNVITGETGAGKSMLVAALELLRGGRAGPHLVRTGETTATVEALIESDTQKLVKRVVRANGRSHAYLDGELCTVADLRTHAAQWLDLSSQHEHHTLADPTSHLEWLDRFAGQEETRQAVAEAVETALQARRAVEGFRQRATQATDRLDLLRFQAGEIERIAPKPGELDEVLAELGRLEHLEELTQLGATATLALHEGPRNAVTLVQAAMDAVRKGARLDRALEPVVERLASVQLELEDLASEVARHTTERDLEPAELEQLRSRELELSKLVRRHGSLEAALERLEALEGEIGELEDADVTLSNLARAAEQALARAAKLAKGLSQARRERASGLGGAVSRELDALGMGLARIQVSVEPLAAGDLTVEGARLGPNGFDRVEFLIAPNPGEEPRPLAKIASGGELSRALLALKQVLAGLGPVSTYVFDEVDTGVGGAVAERIGKKLAEVARHHQVICITHQPVIAAWADTHHVVSKQVSDGRTRTAVRTLTLDERREELARMLGGMELTEGVRQAASDLLVGAGRA